jgi:hypothetical protein
MLLMMVGMILFMGIVMAADPKPPPAAFFVIMGIFMLGISALYSVPAIIAGYALLKKKKWAKTAAIISGVISSMSAPIGTAVCAYTFWFLFSPPGKSIYDPPQQALPPAQDAWYINANRPREAVYTPPQTPPDWR